MFVDATLTTAPRPTRSSSLPSSLPPSSSSGMHYSLKARNVSQIPTRLKPLAQAVDSGSLKAIHSISLMIPSMPRAHAILFLPSLFANVDPARIPNGGQLDALLTDGDPLENIELAFHSLNAIVVLASNRLIPLDASPDIWPSLWTWIDFIQTHWVSLPMAKRADQGEICLMQANILVALGGHRETSKVIRSTPGVRRLLAMAWKAMLHNDALFGGTINLIIGALSIITDSYDNEANFAEIVEGVGGSVEDLASTMIKHFDRFCANPNLPSPEVFLCACFAFFTHSNDPLWRLRAALQSAGFIRALVTTISLIYGTSTRVDSIVAVCFAYIVAAFQKLPGHLEIALALESGLLPVIIKVGASVRVADERPGRIYPMIKELLTELLPRATVHYVVVCQLKIKLQEATDLAVKSRFHKSVFAQDWQKFSKLASERIEILQNWEAVSKSSFKACDNMECGEIALSREFKCCATCQSSNYCSKECQVADWHAGHRDVCRILRSNRLEISPTETLNTRGKSFLRALLTHDYLKWMPGICFEQVRHMHKYPDEALLTVFSYGTGSVEIGVKPASEVSDQCHWAPKFAGEVMRAARSGGRMDVHLMFIYEGHHTRTLFFPLRTSTSTLRDGLVRAVQLIPEGKRAVDADVGPVIEASLAEVIAEVQSEGGVLIH
ncbi:hypothetical protein FB451DRAFT_1560696 [Mycena latifolia]|nr:hypothetical protein FB451DRAFT_1560696 [Mycena latifolia]